eukprot:CAMPEP_0168370694 /NCGR_PEP_ID=MMETSP0228-20121227/7393_1 /TAXON_ID=133427 /ORGANISM="Protoceratium reticulatum, Strain CCCM 535 (=CCMP 1889)" /LENGTH=213 /DNA_ID=CAMNT_0008383569 /DNA_START=16 /DNA_END=656 /DNA_ORIENTATION=-
MMYAPGAVRPALPWQPHAWPWLPPPAQPPHAPLATAPSPASFRVSSPTPPAPGLEAWAPCCSLFLISSAEIIWNAVSTFVASLADASMKARPSSSAFFFASSVGTCRSEAKSHLFPMSTLHVPSVTYLFTSAQPLVDLVKRLAVAYVIHQHDAIRTAVVGAGDGAEALLPSGVPDLELDVLLVHGNGLEAEVHTNRSDVAVSERIVRKTQEEA